MTTRLTEKERRRALVLVCSWNARGKRDGDEFGREARACAQAWTVEGWACDIVEVDKDARLLSAITALRRGPYDAVLYFGHGTRQALPGLWLVQKNLRSFLDVLYACTTDRCGGVLIGLYSCSAAARSPRVKLSHLVGARDPIAFQIAAGLDVRGETAAVFSHATRGHTTRNPHVVMAHGGPSGGVHLTTGTPYQMAKKDRDGVGKYLFLLNHAARPPEAQWMTITQFSLVTGVPIASARRWASTGRLIAEKRGGSKWYVPAHIAGQFLGGA